MLLLFLYDVSLQAAKVLNLGCKASWLCIKRHCGNLSEDAFKDFVMATYTRSAMLLVFLDETNNLKIRKKLIETFKNWSIANDLFEKFPAPIPMVKKWVKV
jgi:separase